MLCNTYYLSTKRSKSLTKRRESVSFLTRLGERSNLPNIIVDDDQIRAAAEHIGPISESGRPGEYRGPPAASMASRTDRTEEPRRSPTGSPSLRLISSTIPGGPCQRHHPKGWELQLASYAHAVPHIPLQAQTHGLHHLGAPERHCAYSHLWGLRPAPGRSSPGRLDPRLPAIASPKAPCGAALTYPSLYTSGTAWTIPAHVP